MAMTAKNCLVMVLSVLCQTIVSHGYARQRRW